MPFEGRRWVNRYWWAFTLSAVFFFISLGQAPAQENAFTDLINLTAVVPREFPPHYSIDKAGKPIGFAIEVMDGIASLAGLKVTYLVENTWEGVLDALENGRADLIPNLGITEQRKAFCTFTAPVETFPISIFVRKPSKDIEGLTDLAGRKVAVVRLNVAVFLLQEREGIGLQIFDEVSQAIFALLSGQVDALVYPEPGLLKMARDSGIDDRIKIVGEPLVEIKRAIAVGKGNPELLARLDRAVGRFVGSSEYKQIYIKWYGKLQPFWTVSRVFLVMSGLLLLIFVAMGLWRYRSVVRLNLQLVENIAGRKKVEKALKTSEERYRTMFKSMNNAIVVYEMRDGEDDFIIRDMNRAAAKIEKVKREDVIGKSLLQVFPGAEDFGIVEVFQRVYKTGQPELHSAGGPGGRMGPGHTSRRPGAGFQRMEAVC